MAARREDFAIGILNYNTRDHLIENLDGCLRSGIPADHIFVLDNCSSDDSVQAMHDRYPQIRIVRSTTNSGYAGGMNQIVKALAAPHVILVTADCYITLDTVRAMLEAMESDRNVALAGCTIIDRRTNRIQSEGGDITYPLGVPLSRRWQAVPGESAQARISDVPYLDGAVLAVDRLMFLEIGGFDESYFAYQEDVDLCWRARLKGHRVVCVGSARVLHVTSAAWKGQEQRRWSLSERNRIANNVKNLELPHLLVALLYEPLYGGALILGGLVFHAPGYARAYLRGMASFLRGLNGVLAERGYVQGMRTLPDSEVLAKHTRAGLLRLAKALSKRAELSRLLRS